MIHAKLKIHASLRMYDLKNRLIIHLVSYVMRLHQEIINLKDLKVYSYFLLGSNQKRIDIDTITI